MQNQALRLRVPYMFVSRDDSGDSKNDDKNPNAYGDFSFLYLFNNFCLEFVAAMVLVYSCMYVPLLTSDPMAQYVPAIAIMAVIMNLKDHSYFCPDGSPMTTVVLLASGAYTRKNDGFIFSDKGQIYSTLWYDVLVRLLGQIMAYIVAHLSIFGPNIHQFDKVPVTELLPQNLSLFNETLATFVECVAIAFVIMPLLIPKDSASGYTTYAAKVDITPPKNTTLALAAASLALIHYVLERIFRTTMNPFIFYMHCYTMGEEACSTSHLTGVMACQIVGLLVACLYCWSFIPPPQTLNKV